MNRQRAIRRIIPLLLSGWLQQADAGDVQLTRVDFSRNSRTEAVLTLQFSGTPLPQTETLKQPRTLTLRMPGASLDDHLERALDLRDFATPVETAVLHQTDGAAILELAMKSGQYDYAVKPVDGQLRLVIRTEAKPVAKPGDGPRSPGGKISLDFQDIAVRSLLQIMADFAAVNIIASDTVTGNMTLKLEDIAWDDAFALILRARELGSIRDHDVIWVAPRDDIHKAETADLEARQAVEALEPLKTEIVAINYTTAEDLQKVLIGTTRRTNTTLGQGTGIGGSSVNQSVSTLDQTESILSARGNVTADTRTNQLIIKDTARNLERIRELIHQLDRPVRQVLIESRIVIASHDFSRELGSKLSLRPPNRIGNDAQVTDVSASPDESNTNSVDLLVDLASRAAAGSGGTVGLTLLKAGDYLLDLELSAAQMEGRGEIISNPRLITADHTKASIKQGVEIPYQVMTASGGGSVSNIQFKEAVLQLDVTPSIAPDNNLLLQLTIKKDAKGQDTTAGPTIDKREMETTARVGNGETVVLGGVFEGTRGNTTHKIPVLGDLPGIGFMFRRNTVSDTRRELLIFITPKILEGPAAASAQASSSRS